MRLPHRVLVADDDDALRTLVVRALRDEGHAVDGFSRARDLLVSLAADPRPPIVVTDHRMPGMTGLDMLEHVLDSRAGFVSSILTTAFPDDDVMRRAHSVGALLLPKPFDLAALRTRVAELVGEIDLWRRTAAGDGRRELR